jgi:tetratricopeptide (TPR) repeat protein
VQWIPIALTDENLQYFGLEVREKLQTIALSPDRQTVLLISGLERSIGAFGEYPAVLSNLNMERDSYPHLLPYPIVLLLPSYAITRCARYAPDFWSWKSIDVQLQSETPIPEISQQIKPIATDLTIVKPVSQSRFDLLTQLLTENSAPTIDRARLLNQLGDAYRSIYENDQAGASYRSALAIYDNLPASLDRAKAMDGLARLYNLQGKYSAALQLWQQALAIQQEIGDRQGEAASLAQMAAIAYQQGDVALERELRLQAATIRGIIGDYGGLIITLHNLGYNDKPTALGYLAQSLWLTIKLLPNLKNSITLIALIYQKIPAGDRLESLLGATAIYLCRSYQHPELAKLTELSSEIIGYAAQQQGIEKPADYDNWITQNRLNDPDYFLPELLKQLEAIIGDNWLFDKAAFLAGNRSTE